MPLSREIKVTLACLRTMTMMIFDYYSWRPTLLSNSLLQNSSELSPSCESICAAKTTDRPTASDTRDISLLTLTKISFAETRLRGFQPPLIIVQLTLPGSFFRDKLSLLVRLFLQLLGNCFNLVLML